MTVGANRMIVYLAGPDIFFPDAIEIGARKKALCRQYGIEGLYPLDEPLPTRPTRAETAMAIYQADLAMMHRADAVIANLTPFRGPSADPGTVFELAWMLAHAKPSFGYSTDPRSLHARTPPDGTTVEDFDQPENLMIACALTAAGTPLVVHEDGLTAFETCLEALCRRAAHASTSDRPGI